MCSGNGYEPDTIIFALSIIFVSLYAKKLMHKRKFMLT